jgi:thiamine-monophosphate kinase
MTISDLGEFGLIEAIAAGLPRGDRTIIGIGDDAAVLAAPDGRMVATTDLLIEGRHFRRDWSGPADIGAKAAAQNLADVAAMGAVPVALLVGFAAPGDVAVAWARDLVAGIAEECARAGATVVGGDTSSADAIVLAITALGDLGGRDPVTRSGARPGDVLAYAGVLGESAAGLALLEAGLTEPAALIAAHRRPAPRYAAGPEAAVLGATAMIDVSDGLLADAGHLARASGVQIDIATTRLPAHPGLAAAVAALGRAGHPSHPADDPSHPLSAAAPGSDRALDWMLTGGEDHALAATFPPDRALPPYWTVIGQVKAGQGVLVNGNQMTGRAGWEHFGD